MSKKKEKNVIRGKFPYKGDDHKKSKKELRKERKKLTEQKDKEILKRCECNHLDCKKNKAHFKKSEDGNYMICQICGGKIICNPVALTPDCAAMAVETIYSVFSYVRNRMKLSEKTDNDITNALKVISRTEDLLRMLIDSDYGEGGKKGKKNKNGKKGKKHKNKNKDFSREVY